MEIISDKLRFKKIISHYIIEPRFEKIIQVTYRVGVGRKMITDNFFIKRPNDEAVWLDRTI